MLSYFQSVSAFVILAGCIKSVTALQQIDLPDGRHENTAMASARTGVCVCARVCVYVRVVLCAREFLRASEIILVKEGLSVSVGVYGGVCRYNFTVAEESL